jgi:RecG-like helicase
MNTAELKIKLFQLLDKHDEAVLMELYSIFAEGHFLNDKRLSSEINLELNYLAMSMDKKREKAAQEWIENTSDFENFEEEI